MVKRITEEECEALFQQYHTPEHVIGHCRAVSNTAVTIGKKLNEHGFALDIDLIKGAGLVHDLARVSDKHWEVGAEILESLGYEDEADIVRVHMTFDFHSFDQLNETDLVCLGDRLVKEDRYVGLNDRIDYIINKAGNAPEITSRILQKKAETQRLMKHIEESIGQTIDSLFMKG